MTTRIDKGIYMILNTKHSDYYRYIQAITNTATNFKPRLSLDGSKAIIQIKQGYKTGTISWVKEPLDRTAVVLNVGNVEWARAQMNRGLTPEKGNEWELPDSDVDDIVADELQG